MNKLTLIALLAFVVAAVVSSAEARPGSSEENKSLNTHSKKWRNTQDSDETHTKSGKKYGMNNNDDDDDTSRQTRGKGYRNQYNSDEDNTRYSKQSRVSSGKNQRQQDSDEQQPRQSQRNNQQNSDEFVNSPVPVPSFLQQVVNNNDVKLHNEALPYLMKIQIRLSKTTILENQESQAKKIFREAKEQMKECEQYYQANLQNNTNYRSCLGRTLGLAMSQIGHLERMSSPMSGNQQQQHHYTSNERRQESRNSSNEKRQGRRQHNSNESH